MNCSRSYDPDLAEAIEASEYEFAFETQLQEVLALSDYELAFQLQIDEAIVLSSPPSDHPPVSDASGTSSDVPLFGRESTVSVSASQHQPSTSRVVFAEGWQRSGSHRDGKELMRTTGMEEAESFLRSLEAITREVIKYSPCMICLESISEAQVFSGLGCSHSLCIPCLVAYVQVTVLEAKMTTLPCADPTCHEYASVEACEQFLPSAMVDAWKNVIIEKDFAPENQRVYCPYKDCAALLVRDPLSDTFPVKSSECPFCHRLFCMDCMVPWHANRSCYDYQNLPEDEKVHEDFLLKNLAREKKWQRCTNCKFFVELTAGCNHMTCRCGHQFCYMCGGKWSSSQHICNENENA